MPITTPEHWDTAVNKTDKSSVILCYTLMEKKRHANKYRMVIDSEEDRLSRGWGKGD